MRATFRVILAASCIIAALICVYGAPQRNVSSLSEEDLIKLIRTGASANALVDLVQKNGIGFQPDEPTLERLRKEGAPDVLLEAIRSAPPQWQYQAEKGEKIRRLKNEGAKNLKSFNADGAIAAFQEVVKTQPSLENLLLLAEAFWMKRDYESLSKTAAQALALDQNSPQAILYQGAVELGQGKTRDALSTIQRGIGLDPRSAFGHELNCDALRLKGDSKKAWLQCVEALRINPDSGFAHNRLGWILWDWRTYPRALGELRKAVQVEPENAYWQSDLAYALIDRGDLPGALVAAREALRLDAKCPYSHDAMGMLLEAQGNVAQAILEFNEAIRLAPLANSDFLAHLNGAMRKAKSER